jgi:eukaryotic-like serine/threonine-protein kinase
MKNILKNPAVKKILYVLLGLIVFIVLLNNVIMPWYVSEPEEKVPNVISLKEEKALETLKDANLEPVISDTTFDERYPRGTIILQKPTAGENVKEGRRIYLFVSGGEPVVLVPSLKGRSVRDAKFSLERLGLTLGHVDNIPSSNPKNMIFDQQYVEGTPLKKGDSVGVSVSAGEEYGEITVPDLIGKSLTEAEKILQDSSLSMGKINYQPSFSLLPNTVLDQYPSKGNKANKGDQIDLFVTKSAESKNQNEETE